LQAEAARWSELGDMRDGGKTKGLGTASRMRLRLPGDSLIAFDLGLGLSGEVPAPLRLRGIVPGGAVAGGGLVLGDVGYEYGDIRDVSYQLDCRRRFS
jgi:hypothetical protein